MDFKSLCEEFDKTKKKIKFYLVRRGNKKLTIIQGLDHPKYQMKLYKRKYACNAFLKYNKDLYEDLYLQGDHIDSLSQDLGT